MSHRRCGTTIQQLEEVIARTGFGVKMLAAVYDAMVYGKAEPEFYNEALYGAYDYLSSLNEEAQEIIEEHYNLSEPRKGDDGKDGTQ